MDYSKLPSWEIERLARSIHPGAWAVETEQPLGTLLGSCVAVCLFDPQLRLGGMNHFMLPNLRRGAHDDVDSLLAGDFAMEALLNAMLQRGAKKARLQAKAFGGGTIIDVAGSLSSVGQRNTHFARDWLEREGIPLTASDFLGPWSRKVLFVPNAGDAYCKRVITTMATAETICREEKAYADRLLAKPPSGSGRVELF